MIPESIDKILVTFIRDTWCGESPCHHYWAQSYVSVKSEA